VSDARQQLTVEREVRAPAEVVWAHVNDIERYPDFTESVREVVVTRREGTERDAAWEVLLRGSVLRWTERAVVDDDARTVTFHQLDGDLSHLAGTWRLTATTPVVARLEIEFEIGIPLLARMLTPIAVEALRENATAMLAGVDRDLEP
jgi:ribosome-associated toxin RatA of RatAB toxin-antitoxin module